MTITSGPVPHTYRPTSLETATGDTKWPPPRDPPCGLETEHLARWSCGSGAALIAIPQLPRYDRPSRSIPSFPLTPKNWQ